MQLNMALGAVTFVAVAFVADITVGGSSSLSSSGSKRKVEAVVDTNSLKITQHAVQKKNENSGAWEHEPNESCESEYRKCAEEPWRPYLPGCTAMMIFDCNANGISDVCEIANGAADIDHDCVLDSCEYAIGDLNLDGVIDDLDLNILLSWWGIPNPPLGDLNKDGIVNAVDLGILLGRFGVVVY
jgi:hypothetical protein